MTKHEGKYITNALEAKGYESRFVEVEGGVVVVRDPVQSSLYGRQYKDVTLRTTAAMYNFIHERS